MSKPHRSLLQTIEEETGHIDFSIPESLTLPSVDALLNRKLLSGGKKLRPYVCLQFGRMLGVDRSRLELCAKIAEIVHSASLAHDDVVDEALIRRGRPTLNALTSNPQAVLAGDLLLARATTLCLELGHLRLAKDLSETLEELVAGEWLQLEARGRIEIGARHLERVSLAKTASLLRWCFLAPLRLTRIDEHESQIEDLARELARLIGLAFQMSDDCVDYSEESGKQFGKDFSEGLVNWVSWTLIARGRAPDPSLPFGWELSEIRDAVAEVQERASAKLRMALTCLDRIDSAARQAGLEVDAVAKQNLATLISALEKRSF